MGQSVEASTARDAANITPDDNATVNADAIYVGTGGNVTVITPRGSSVIFKNVPAGTQLMQAAAKILATGTTASDIVAMKF